VDVCGVCSFLCLGGFVIQSNSSNKMPKGFWFGNCGIKNSLKITKFKN